MFFFYFKNSLYISTYIISSQSTFKKKYIQFIEPILKIAAGKDFVRTCEEHNRQKKSFTALIAEYYYKYMYLDCFSAHIIK